MANPKEVEDYVKATQELAQAAEALWDQFNFCKGENGEPDRYEIDLSDPAQKKAFDEFEKRIFDRERTGQALKAFFDEQQKIKQALEGGSLILPGTKAFNITRRRFANN